MKRCPDCAELIQDQARICRFCGKEIPFNYRPDKPAQIGGYDIGRYYPGLIIVGFIMLIALSDRCSRKTEITQATEEAQKPAVPPVTTPEQAPVEPDRPNSLEVKFMAERNLKNFLKDPTSAELRGVRVPSGAAYACGEVNSRNSFGGMTGYKRFIAGAASSMPVAVEGENMEVSEFETSWAKLC